MRKKIYCIVNLIPNKTPNPKAEEEEEKKEEEEEKEDEHIYVTYEEMALEQM